MMEADPNTKTMELRSGGEMKLYYIRMWMMIVIIPALILLVIEGFTQRKISRRTWFADQSKEFIRFVKKMWRTGNGH